MVQAAAVPYIKLAIAIVSIGVTVGMAASQKPATSTGPRMGDLTISAATYGLPIPKGWGVCRLGGNMIWTSGITEGTQTRNVGGKGGGSKKGVNQTTFNYSASFAFAFAAGPANRILRVWADSKLVYDATSEGEVTVPITMRMYMGTEDQLPDPAISAAQGADQTPAFRGLVYLVAEDVPLEPFGNRIPNISCEVAFQGDSHLTFVKMTDPIPFDARPPQYQTEDWRISSQDQTVDFLRDEMYMCAVYIYTTDGLGGMVVGSLDPMQINRMVPTVELYSESDFMMETFEIGSIRPTFPIIGAGTDLYVAMMYTGGYRGYFVRINPESMKVTGQYGSNIPGGSFTNVGGTAADAVCSPMGVCLNYTYSISGQLRPVIAYSGYNNGPVIFDGLSMTHLWGAKRATVGGAEMPTHLTPRLIEETSNIFANNATVPGRRNNDGTCEFWWIQWGWHLADGTAIDPCIDVWRITVPAGFDFELAFTIPIRPILGAGVTQFYMGRAEYDLANDSIIMFLGTSHLTQNHLISVSRSGSLNWHTINEFSMISFGPCQSGHSLLLGSTFAYAADHTYVIDTTTGAVIEDDVAVSSVGLSVQETSWSAYNSINMTIYMAESWDGTSKLLVNRGTASTTKLSTIVHDLAIEAGMTEEQIDVEVLTDDVIGYSRVQEVARNLISDLCQAYFWDFTESNFKLVAKKRGGAPVATIPYANLLPLGTSPAVLPVLRNQAESLPRRYWVRYSDVDHDQQQGTAHWARAEKPVSNSVINSAGELTLDMRLVLNADQAKTIAKKRLLMLWGERELFPQFGLPPAYMHLDPSDVVILQTRDGFSYRTRIDKISIGADLSLQLEGGVEDPNLLTVTAPAFGGSGNVPSFVPAPYQSVSVQPEMPLMRDGDDLGGTALRQYGAIGSGRGQTFLGATTYVSPDTVSWANLLSSSQSMIWGTTINTLPAPPTLYSTDTVDYLDVAMSFGGDLLESATSAQVLEGANVGILITVNGEVEVLQWRTVTPRAAGVYRLTGLLRGRKGSEWVVGRHHSAERFVVLDLAGWRASDVPLGYLNTLKYEKTVGLFDVFDSVLPVPRTFLGTAEKPYAPVWITSSRDMGTNDLTISWQRRTRIGGEWIDGTEAVTLGENSEAYDIDVLATDDSVIRTLHATTQSVLYNNANQTTDGMAASPIRVAIYQISDAIGRGYPGYGTLPDPSGDTGSPTVTLTGITLSNSSVSAGVSPPKVVGVIVVSTTGGPFIGAVTLAGPDAAKFSIVGNTLYTATTLAIGSYHINMVASQSGAGGSPMAQAKIVTAISSGAPTISSITLSDAAFVSGTSGLAIGSISVTMTSGSFTGSLSLGGADAALFTLAGDTLTTATATPPGTYNISIIATQVGATGSPFSSAKTLTATTTLHSVHLSSTSVASGSSGATVGTISVNSTGTFTGTLSLLGTHASSFTIVGNLLKTSTSLAAGSYSISIRATQSGAANSPKTTAFTILASVGGSLTAPSQAVSAGFTTLNFHDDFTSTSTIATTQNATSGYKWYWAQRSGAPVSPTEWSVNTTATAATVSNGNTGGGSNASASGGILTLNTGLFPNANLITVPGWAMNSGLTSMPPLNVGRWKHCYFECYVQFQPDFNTSAIYTSNGWPAIWFWAAEGLNDYGFPGSGYSTSNTTELDLLESFGNTTWAGGGGSSGPANSNVSNIINWQTTTNSSYATVTPLDSEWHTLGLLWTPGIVTTYWDNAVVASQTLAPNFSALDTQSLFLTIGTGPSWIVNFDWIRVWTA